MSAILREAVERSDNEIPSIEWQETVDSPKNWDNLGYWDDSWELWERSANVKPSYHNPD